MWVRFKDIQKDYFGNFPYKTFSPLTGKIVKYNSIDDVWNELEKVYDNTKDKGFNIGEALYTHSNFIVNNSILVDAECQKLINEYYYSKLSNTPPYSSIQDTPKEYMDKYIIIDNETKYIADKENAERKK